MRRVLVTGGTGFVGQHLVSALKSAGWLVRRAVRDDAAVPVEGVETVYVGPLARGTDWREALEGVDSVAHLAARAHILEERAEDPLEAFMAVNTDGTLALARAAAGAGVRRFLFMSSIKVNGEASPPSGYAATDPPAPADAYGISKQRAEEGLAKLAMQFSLPVVVLRPPLVYGPGVGANFLRLMKLVDLGIPLPLSLVHNKRSLVSVWSLCDLVLRCLDAPEAVGRTFMVSDGRDLSTAELAQQLATALGKRARLMPMPPGLLRLAARLTGQMAEYTRLCASLTVDMKSTEQTLNWRPICSQEEAFARTVRWYRDASSRKS